MEWLYEIYELEPYDPNEPVYEPPYGFDIRIKGQIADKYIVIDESLSWEDKNKELNRQMAALNLPGHYHLRSAISDDGYYLDASKHEYKYLLKQAPGQGRMISELRKMLEKYVKGK